LKLSNQTLPAETPSTPPASGTRPNAPPAPVKPQVKLDKAFRGFRSSPWRFTTSAGASGSILVLGASGGYLALHNDKTGENRRLYYGSAGGGIGITPGSFQVS